MSQVVWVYREPQLYVVCSVVMSAAQMYQSAAPGLHREQDHVCALLHYTWLVLGLPNSAQRFEQSRKKQLWGGVFADL